MPRYRWFSLSELIFVALLFQCQVSFVQAIDMQKRSITPIIVGGTFYFVENLLFPVNTSVVSSSVCGAPGVDDDADSISHNSSSTSTSAVSDYDRLCQVDPIMARKLHPNDSRKILRALQLFDQTGIPMSKHILSQPVKQCGVAPILPDAPSVVLNPLVLFLYSGDDLVAFDSRLDSRVDQMVANGLLLDVLRLHITLLRDGGFAAAWKDNADSVTHPYVKQCLNHYRSNALSDSTEKRKFGEIEETDENISASGLHESIGFREFIHVLLSAFSVEEILALCAFDDHILDSMKICPHAAQESALDFALTVFLQCKARALDNDSSFSDQLRCQLVDAIDALKRNTRRYARVQLRWVKRRFYSAVQLDQGVNLPAPIYRIDCSPHAASDWDSNILQPALALVRSFLRRESMPPISEFWPARSFMPHSYQELLGSAPSTVSLASWQKHHCDVCDKTMNGLNEWQAHVKTKQHKRRYGLQRKAEAHAGGSTPVVNSD
jgi:tRNA dimethylallyltransferase